MNDMSTHPANGRKLNGVPAPFGIDDAHILRSKIIGKCAAVECWLGEQISAVEKPELMLSQKIEQLKTLSDQRKIVFRRPQILKDRLAAFRSFADFRSEIVHSVMTLSTLDGTATVIFENAAQTGTKMFRKKILISREEFESIWREMSSAANLLTTLKTAQPSSSRIQRPVEDTVTPAKVGV